ncbi:MAG: hypothetical protein SGILL_000520 [Bacillariaceae sp.]
MNSVLQSLASLGPFLAYLDGIVQCQQEMKEAGISMSADPLDLTSGKTSFSRQLLDLLDDINSLEEELKGEEEGHCGNRKPESSAFGHRWRRRRKTINPKPLLQMIGEHSDQFKSKPFALMEQQDAQEFLSALLALVIEGAQLNTLLDRRFMRNSGDMERNSSKTSFQFIDRSRKRDLWAEENNEDDLLTSAMANSFFKEDMIYQNNYAHADDIGTRAAGLSLDSSLEREDTASVLSLSGLLLRIENENRRNAAKANGDTVDTLSAVKPPLCIQQEKRFQEEKKQDHCEHLEVVECVKDVECRYCTIQREKEHLEEEAMMLRGAIDTMEKRSKRKSASSGPDDKTIRSSDHTRYLRGDLQKVDERLLQLNTMDPDEDNVPGLPLGDIFDDFGDKATITIERCVARKCLLLTRIPSILCCHIQRRYFDPFTNRMEKCIQHVAFPDILDISPYCAYGPRANIPWAAGDQCRSPTKLTGTRGNIPYRLQSVIEHRGNAYGGHYVCYRKDQSGQWYLVSDEAINPVHWSTVRYSQAYLLFYEAI